MAAKSFITLTPGKNFRARHLNLN